MADHQNAATEMDADFSEHQKTYALFTWLVKWGAITIVFILVMMAVFLL